MFGAQKAFERAKGLFNKAVKWLQELRWKDVLATVRKYIKEHSYLTAVQLVMLLVLICPGLVVTPMLGWIGFSSIGPVAGTFAAWFQSTFGATWIFSGLQGAATAGYAAGAVNGIVQGVAALGGVVAHWFKRK